MRRFGGGKIAQNAEGALMDRRSFFQSTAATAALAALAKPFSAYASTVKDRPAGEVAADEDFWAELRNEFTVDRTVVNFNNGYASPAPRSVQEAMRRYLDYTNMGPYHTMVQQLDKRIESARRMLAEVAGCDAVVAVDVDSNGAVQHCSPIIGAAEQLIRIGGRTAQCMRGDVDESFAPQQAGCLVASFPTISLPLFRCIAPPLGLPGADTFFAAPVVPRAYQVVADVDANCDRIGSDRLDSEGFEFSGLYFGHGVEPSVNFLREGFAPDHVS